MLQDDERLRVWHILSWFWTDNEVEIDDLVRMSEELAATRFTIDELEQIYADEVAPATARYVAGIPISGGMAVPIYYSPEEIAARIREYQSRSWARRRLNPFRRLIDRISASFPRRDWERVKYKIQRIREQGAA